MLHIVDYARRFGAVAGILLYYRLKLVGARSRVRVPGLAATLIVRRGTSDRSYFRKIFVSREYDPPRALPESATFIIDGGANVGYAAVFFAVRYPEARVVAIEPEPANFEILSANCAAYPNITPIRAALWGSTGRVRITDPHAASGAARVAAVAGEGVEVPALTTTDIMRRFGADRVSVLKLDIEGAEDELFGDADVSWLAQVDCLMIELHGWMIPGSGEAFERAVAGHPFRRTRYGENEVLVREGAPGQRAR